MEAQASEWVSASAAVIALAALAISTWEAMQARRHCRLSVTPRLRLDTCAIPDRPITLTLSNQGIGPAIVSKVALHDGSLWRLANTPEAIRRVLETLGLNESRFSFDFPVSGDGIAAGESFCVLQFPDSGEPSGERDILVRQLSRLGVRIDYECIYGQRFVAEPRVLVDPGDDRS